MKLLFEIFPVILFFAIYWLGEGHPDTANSLANQYLSTFMSNGVVSGNQGPMMLATASAIVVTIGIVSYYLLRRKKVGVGLWISLIVIVLFGGLTIYFNNDNFIKIKPTALYWCFATALAASKPLFKVNALQTLMGGQITLPERIWGKLNLAWIVFFICMGVANLLVAFVLYKDNTGAWVNFKLMSLGINFVFILLQSIYLSRYMEEPK
ncbi:MAG TPA: septation protein A [Burkholderiaceae bacterium]|jgi:intracellular septation protein